MSAAPKRTARPHPITPITLSISAFCEVSSLSRMTVWRLCKRGDLEAVSIGSRRLIIMASYYALLERRRAEEAA
jgi:hypothetical protein